MLKSFTFLLALLFTVHLSAQNQPTTADWLADLRHYQQTIHEKYPFLFVKTTPEAFDQKVEELAGKLPEMARHEVIAGFARLAASFEYGHTYVWLRGEEIGYHQLPINLYEFSDGIFVEGSSKQYAKLLGAKVVKVAGVPVAKALNMIRPIVPAENDQYMKGYGLKYLTYPEVLHAQGVTKTLDQEITLTLEKDGTTYDATVVAGPMVYMNDNFGFVRQNEEWLSVRDQSTVPYYLKNLDKKYYFDYLSDDRTIYVRYSSVFPDETESIQDFYDRVFAAVEEKEVDKLVIDVRLNGGGNNFNNKHVIQGLIRSDKINQVGKLFVIIGRRTFSACQNLVNELHNYTNVIFVGEPTGENINFYGDNRPEDLPNSKLPIRMSWAWWQDKAPWQNGDWMAPQLPTKMSLEDYRTNRDPALERALAFDEENYLLDPMAHLTDLFLARKIPELQKEAARLVQDPNYAYFDFMGEFNKAGHRLMDSGQLEASLFLFNLTAQFYPESAECQSSLAQALAKSGQRDKAAALFKRAIELDPEGKAGARAKEMLAELK